MSRRGDAVAFLPVILYPVFPNIVIYVKQYGAKRSGTNFTKWLLEANFHVSVLSETLGWKHGPHPESVDWSGNGWSDPRFTHSAKVPHDLRKAVEKSELRYIITTKNPYAWWVSLVRFARLKPAHALSAQDAADVWVELHTNWLGLARQPLAEIVRYEDLLCDSHGTLDRLATLLRLSKSRNEYITPDWQLRPRGDDNWGMEKSSGDRSFDPSYYLEKRYLTEIEDNVLSTFRTRLPKALVETLGYKLL